MEAAQDVVPSIAEAFHTAYEQLAPALGYKTRESSAVPWKDVPADNKKLMEETVRKLIIDGVICSGQVRGATNELAKALKQLVNASLPPDLDLDLERPFWIAARNARATLDTTRWVTGINGEQIDQD